MRATAVCVLRDFVFVLYHKDTKSTKKISPNATAHFLVIAGKGRDWYIKKYTYMLSLPQHLSAPIMIFFERMLAV